VINQLVHPAAREFYEEQALRGGWSVRQLGRQVSSRFYERTLLSKNKAAMLRRGAKPKSGDQAASGEGDEAQVGYCEPSHRPGIVSEGSPVWTKPGVWLAVDRG
jgi:hypothetical protein